MQNNNIRKTIPEPLMFIHTVSTPITTSSSRVTYDSRDGKNINITKKEFCKKDQIDLLLFKKIQNIIQMYKQGTGVECLIETSNNESIEGIPFDIIDEEVLINQNEQVIKITLNEIIDVIILKL